MRIQIENDKSTVGTAKSSANSIVSLNGGNSHIIKDGHFYVLVNRIYKDAKGQPAKTDKFMPSPFLFGEAIKALAKLPPP